MKELKVSEFYDMVISILESILKEVVSENPDGKAIFPCIVVQAPMRLDEKTGEYVPILSRFSITIEAWTKRKSSSIELADEIDSKLRGYNFTRTGTPIDLYDENTKCHRYGGSYEVFYNALTNSLEKVK
ncbi:MAG: hypothetical protein HFI86_05875 [Bacilli bacterium]|nr:hypothetical protein [Bacilli bacterium]